MSQTKVQAPRKRQWIVVEAVFLLAIWFPNIAYICYYAPVVNNPTALIAEMRSRPWAFSDFLKYYACADLISHGAKATVWDPQVQSAWIKKYLSSTLPEGKTFEPQLLAVGEYTPQFLVFMTPLLNMPVYQALAFWQIFNLLWLLIPVTILLRKYSSLTTKQMCLWWMIILASGPCWYSFSLGQSAALVTGLQGCYYLTLMTGRNLAAGIVAALLAIIKPQRVLIPLAMALFTRRYKIIATVVVASLAIACIAASVTGWDTFVQYPSRLAELIHKYDSGQQFYSRPPFVSIEQPLTSLFGAHVARIMLTIVSIVGFIGTCVIWSKAYKAGVKSYPFAFAASVLLDLATSTRAVYYDFLVLAVAWAVTIPAVEFDRIKEIPDRKLRWWCWVFVFFPAVNWILLYSKIYDGGPLHFPVIIFMLYLAWLNLRPLLNGEISSQALPDNAVK
jgi:hypothetical protein